ncbi:MAG: 2-dehydro-3-deoxy-D-gluconate 5-dehydrogenase KduD [Proteobacteria bacterium]|nr:2-dehydro-3-deoxy-D-gluconate 5-dehydrogenase KduD [Pseudomonadota bacterium]
MKNPFDLTGKKALVTGCSRGIGKAMAVALAQAGADVIGVSTTLKKSGGGVEREVLATGRKFHAYDCDFSDRMAVNVFLSELTAEHSELDILVANAGTIRRAPAVDHSDEDWDYVMDVNLRSQFVMAREIGKQMIKRGQGKIVFTASLLSFQGGITVPGYAASKGGIAQLTKALSNEWAGKGINVNAIAPGYIATDNTAALRADEVRNNAILSRIPAGRWGTPEDLTGALVFLCSDASAYVHGEILTIDGGWMAR